MSAAAGPTLLLAGGGTAGHVFPLLAAAREVARSAPWLTVELVGVADGVEARLADEAGLPLHAVPAAPLRRRWSADLLRLPWVLASAARRASRLCVERGAVACGVFGGYVAVPLALAARRRRLPLVVHEQNLVPGLANRLAARWATAVAAPAEEVVERLPRGTRTVVTGNPVRPGFEPSGLDRPEARRRLGLDPDRRTLLAFGGSQGARRINDALLASADRWAAPQATQVLHLPGRRDHDDVVRGWAERLGPGRPDGEAATTFGGDGALLVRCQAWLDDMPAAMAAADLVVSRAGASTLAELTLAGRAALLVPYPHATADHQRANAEALARRGGAVVVADADLDAAALVERGEALLADPPRRARMERDSAAAAAPRAAEDLAGLLIDAARHGPPRGRRRPGSREER